VIEKKVTVEHDRKLHARNRWLREIQQVKASVFDITEKAKAALRKARKELLGDEVDALEASIDMIAAEMQAYWTPLILAERDVAVAKGRLALNQSKFDAAVNFISELSRQGEWGRLSDIVVEATRLANEFQCADRDYGGYEQDVEEGLISLLEGLAKEEKKERLGTEEKPTPNDAP